MGRLYFPYSCNHKEKHAINLHFDISINMQPAMGHLYSCFRLSNWKFSVIPPKPNRIAGDGWLLPLVHAWNGRREGGGNPHFPCEVWDEINAKKYLCTGTVWTVPMDYGQSLCRTHNKAKNLLQIQCAPITLSQSAIGRNLLSVCGGRFDEVYFFRNTMANCSSLPSMVFFFSLFHHSRRARACSRYPRYV